MMYTDSGPTRPRPASPRRKAIALKYTGNAVPADDLATPVPSNGIINYPTHVAPLWTRNRGANTCTSCHNDPDKLDLSATIGGDGRDDVVRGGDARRSAARSGHRPAADPRSRKACSSSCVVRRWSARWRAKATRSAWRARAACIEIMTGADADVGRRCASRASESAVDRARPLEDAERGREAPDRRVDGPRRQVLQRPVRSGARNVRTITGLDEDTFATKVLPILTKTCAAACHQAIGSDASSATNWRRSDRHVVPQQPLRPHRRLKGDYGVTLSMISNACNPASNYLLEQALDRAASARPVTGSPPVP